MARDGDRTLAPAELPEIVRKIRAHTPARILAGRAGAAYRTGTQLELREAHAAARDAVRAELDLTRGVRRGVSRARWNLLELTTQARSKDEYLLRPDLGRHFDDASREKLRPSCPHGADFQIVIGDGLSVPAVAAQVPALLPLLAAGAVKRGWSLGRPIVIHHCRVGHPEPNWRTAGPTRCRIAYRRAPRPGHRRKSLGVYGLPATHKPLGRRS